MDVRILTEKQEWNPEAECRYHLENIRHTRQDLHRHDYYEIFLTLGEVTPHLVGERLIELKRGSLVLIRPWDIHGYPRMDNQQKYFANLSFSERTMDQLLLYLSDGFPARELLEAELPPTVLLSEEETERLYRRFDALNAVPLDDMPRLKLQARQLIFEMMTRYFIQLGVAWENRLPAWLDRLCHQMEERQNFAGGTERMLTLSGKSRTHLSRTIQRYFHVSLSEYVNNLRLNYIANMLQGSEVPILDLCFDAGFQNVGWFYRLFKKKYGLAPKEFRQQNRIASR